VDEHVGGVRIDHVVTVPPSGDFEVQQRSSGGRKTVDRVADLLIIEILQHRQTHGEVICALWFPVGDVNV
jgi:hypothetical protein